MIRHYATVCHARQLPVLLASMRRHCAPFLLHVLAWDYDPHDDPCLGPDVEVTPRAEFLALNPDYHPTLLPGPTRRPVDVICTVRWAFFADVIERTGEPLTCIDGDLFFFASPEPVFAEIGAATMAVTPHLIPPRAAGLPGVVLETHAQYGRHNAGWVYAADPEPLLEMARLNREWSYTEVVPRGPGRRPLFGDQAWLEDVAERYGAHEIAAPVNVGPWSVHGQHIRSFTPPGGPQLPASYPVVGHPPQALIAYHFSSLRLAPDGSVAQLANPCYEITPWQASLIYEPYLAAIRKESRP